MINLINKELKLETVFIKNPWKWHRPLTYLSWIIRQVTKPYNTIDEFVPNHIALRITKPNGEVWISDFQSHYKYRREKYWLLEDANRLTTTRPFLSNLTDDEILEEVENGTRYKGYEHRKLISYFTHYKLGFDLFPVTSTRFVCFEWVGYLKGLGINNFALPKDLI
jgi:hypothetical protein